MILPTDAKVLTGDVVTTSTFQERIRRGEFIHLDVPFHANTRTEFGFLRQARNSPKKRSFLPIHWAWTQASMIMHAPTRKVDCQSCGLRRMSRLVR